MKLRKIVGVVLATVMAMTCAQITLPAAVSAEAVNTDTVYREDFEGFANTNYSPTLSALEEYGWYASDNNTLYTEIGSVAPYSTYSGKFAKITNKDGSQVLQIVSAGEGNSTQNADIPKYGYAKTFPGVAPGEAATGSWEISFDFKPYLVSNKTQFAFTLNTGDNSDKTEIIAQHNIIAGYDQKFYLGYRNYNTLLNNSVKQATLKAVDIGGVTWYTVKTFLNCDERYYSVEIYNRSTGALIARRSPVSFDAYETVGFLKFSALGFKQNSCVYIDNISIAKTEKYNNIYNETFDTFTNGAYRADDGMATGGATEDFTGTSYFEGYTPWRFHESVGNSYALENDATLSSQVVRLGDVPATTGETEASGLVYMQADEPLINRTTEPLRGMLKMGFKIKPEGIVNDVAVNVIPDVKIDITSDDCAVFKIKNNSGTPAILKGNGEYAELDPSKWYDVTLTFDVIGRTVKTAVKDLEGNTVAENLVVGTMTPYAVRALMFKADGGSSVLVDDIKLEYCAVAPSIDQSRIVLTDRFGGEVTDLNNVTTALKSIEIPVGCPIDSTTANSSTILLKDSGSNTVGYTGSISGNSYIIKLNDALSLNEEYTVTIPKTLANTSGDELGRDVTFTFKTLNAVMDISAVKVNNEPFAYLSDITAGSTVKVAVTYNNDTDAAVKSAVVFALYSDSKIVYIGSADFSAQPHKYGTNDAAATFTIPGDINADAIDRMSVFVWDGMDSMRPLANSVNVKDDDGPFSDYVDFTVNIPGGRDAVILQLTDPQIIDSTQVREGVTFSQQKRDFWQPTLMNQRLFNDLRKLINEVKPDLILLTGDLVYGGYDDAGTSFTKLADFLDGYDIPWAPVFGNHDNESMMGVDWQCNYLENCKNCLFKQRTLTGNGNYSIGIVQGGKLNRVIFMLDSNGCGAMSDESFANGHSKKSGGFGDDQIEWYTAAAEKINKDFGNMKYTFAFHIQLAAFEDALHETYGFVNGGEVDENKNLVSPLNIDEREDKKDTDFGYIGRSMKTPWDDNRAVYNGMKALGADSILVGHEHCNNASVVYDGIRFQYGQKIGEYDRINFRTSEGKIVGFIAIETSMGTPILGGTVMKLSESTGAISDAYIHYCSR